MNYYKGLRNIGEDRSIRICCEELLFHKDFEGLLENILLMITEDIRNIMTLVKGIIVKLTINESKRRVSKVVLSSSSSIYSVDYEVKESLLYVTFNLEVKKNLN